MASHVSMTLNKYLNWKNRELDNKNVWWQRRHSDLKFVTLYIAIKNKQYFMEIKVTNN
jgi:hypothetical protein